MKTFKQHLIEADLDNWENYREVGKVDGVPHGFGGEVTLLKANNKKSGKEAWFLKHPRLGHTRMISSDHVLVRKFKYPDRNVK